MLALTRMVTKGMGLGKAFLEPADGFEDLVAFLEAAVGDARWQFLQGLGQAAALAAAHGAFLVPAWFAAGQQVVNLVTLEQLDFDFGIVGQALPAGTVPSRFEMRSGRGVWWPADNVGPVR